MYVYHFYKYMTSISGYTCNPYSHTTNPIHRHFLENIWTLTYKSIITAYSWQQCGKRGNCSSWASSYFATLFLKVVCWKFVCKCDRVKMLYTSANHPLVRIVICIRRIVHSRFLENMYRLGGVVEECPPRVLDAVGSIPVGSYQDFKNGSNGFPSSAIRVAE